MDNATSSFWEGVKFTHVMNVAGGEVEDDGAEFYGREVFYQQYDMIDKEDTNAIPVWMSATETLSIWMRAIRDQNGQMGNILVRCRAGASRSVSIIVAYLVRYESLPVVKALALVKRKRLADSSK